MKAYSQDLLVELDHELADVYPQGPNILYALLDRPSTATKAELHGLFRSRGLDDDTAQRVFGFLLYCGVIGLRIDNGVQYIFEVNYDSKVLTTRAQRQGAEAKFVVDPAFWDALGITAAA
jgi:hypothetical protein